MAITLESLLVDEYNNGAAAVMTPEEAAMECADVFAELSDIEMTLTTYEAAKIIKKAKSDSKKVKVEKKVMKAKDAKATKAGGKVVKMKKVGVEGDETLDGGTGPLPTTTDTNGLTDTDLDVDPNADIEVTTVTDNQPSQEEIVGTEGVDFIVEYEDAKILEFEDESQKWYQKMGESLKKFWDAIVNFVKSVVDKIVKLLPSDEKFFAKHKEAIAKGLASDATVKINVGIAKDLAKQYENQTTLAKALTDAKIPGFESDDKIKQFEEAETDKTVGEVKLSEIGNSVLGPIGEIVSSGVALFKGLSGVASKKANEAVGVAKKAKDKATLSEIRAASAKFQKLSSKLYRDFMITRGVAVKIMHAAAKAGGAKIEESKEIK